MKWMSLPTYFHGKRDTAYMSSKSKILVDRQVIKYHNNSTGIKYKNRI